MTNEVMTTLEETVETGDPLFFSERLGQQTALIEILTVAAAVLLAAAIVFIVISIKRKNRGRG